MAAAIDEDKHPPLHVIPWLSLQTYRVDFSLQLQTLMELGRWVGSQAQGLLGLFPVPGEVVVPTEAPFTCPPLQASAVTAGSLGTRTPCATP